MFRGGRLHGREVIDAHTAKHIGYVVDIEIDEQDGRLTAVIIIRGGFFKRLFCVGETVVPWSSITAISESYVLVNM